MTDCIQKGCRNLEKRCLDCGKLIASYNMQIGHFDPGPFYKEEEINAILEEGFNAASAWHYIDSSSIQKEVINNLMKYLDENYKRAKDGN